METAWKAGQRAALGRKRLVTVERVTPSGRAVVEGFTFYPDGTQRGENYWRSERLEHLTPEIEQEMALTERVRAVSQHAFKLISYVERWLRDTYSFHRAPYELEDVEKAERLVEALRAIMEPKS